MKPLLTVEEMREFAEIERQMDAGELSYVKTEYGRLAFPPFVLDECGVVSGQTASPAMVLTLMQMTVSSMALDAQINEMMTGHGAH